MRNRVLILLLAISVAHCSHRQKSHAVAGSGGLTIGDYQLAPGGIEDGDTIRVVGIEQSLRLLGIDTEETFKKEAERIAAEADWGAYVTRQRGDAPRPVKMGSPLGEEAKRWAQAFFDGVTTVRLERDHPKEIFGRYGRLLTYVFARKGGAWLNYNVECVRAGMSPYFMKYGYSRRYHDAFVTAQEEARAAKRGIWDPTLQHYPDYDERLVWWNARGAAIRAFEQEAEGKPDHLVLTNEDAIERLQAAVGREMVIFGSVGRIRDKGGTILVFLGRRHNADFPLVFFARKVFEESKIVDYDREYVRIRGEISLYENPRTGESQLQVVVSDAGQVQGAGPGPAEP